MIGTKLDSGGIVKARDMKAKEGPGVGSGFTSDVRGTMMSQAPTPGTTPTLAVKFEDKPMVQGSKGSIKQMNDNVAKHVERRIQENFNTGKNATNNISGLSQKQTGPIPQIINTDRPDFNKLQVVDIPKEGFFKRAISVFSDDDNRIGSDIKTADLFQEASFKLTKNATEVACNDKKGKSRFITSEEKESKD